MVTSDQYSTGPEGWLSDSQPGIEEGAAPCNEDCLDRATSPSCCTSSRQELNATKRRLAAALTIEDLRSIAKRRTPKVAFDYADGAAETELSLSPGRVRHSVTSNSILASQILTEQITRTMRLLGARTLDELNAAHITRLERLGRKGADVGGGECP